MNKQYQEFAAELVTVKHGLQTLCMNSTLYEYAAEYFTAKSNIESLPLVGR